MRNLFIKVIVTLLLIVIVLGTFFLFNKKTANDSGSIIINLYDLNNELVDNKEVNFFKEDRLFDLLDANYELEYEKGIYGIILYGIGTLKSDFKETYIAIYVNGEYSNYGVDGILLKNGLIIDFKVEKIWN